MEYTDVFESFKFKLFDTVKKGSLIGRVVERALIESPAGVCRMYHIDLDGYTGECVRAYYEGELEPYQRPVRM